MDTPQEVVVAEPKQNSKKKLILISVALFLVLLMSAIITLIFVTQKKSTNISSTGDNQAKTLAKDARNDTQSSDFSSPSNERRKKSYINQSEKFSIDYPDDWVVEDQEDQILTLFPPTGEFVEIGVIINPKGLDLTNFMQQNYSPEFISSLKNLSINGKSGLISEREQSYYTKLPNNNILTIHYLECEEPDCKAGKLDPSTLQTLISTIQFF